MWSKITAFFMSIIAFFMGLFGIGPKDPPVEKPGTLSFADALVQYMPEDENYMVSPLSAAIAFGMLANGARGDTLTQILGVLGIEELGGYNEYIASLIKKYSKADFLKLSICDSVWLNTDNAGGISFKKSFTDVLKDYYEAQKGFVTNANAVETINAWVSDKTQGRIPTIIDSSDFLCYLINAIYFKATWEKAFNEGATSKDVFTSRDGSRSRIDFMHARDEYNYYESSDGTKIVELPYVNMSYGEDGRIRDGYSDLNLSMYVILSDGEVYPEYLLNNVTLSPATVILSMPKFKTEFDFELKDILVDMGMTDAFDPERADLTNAFDNLGARNAYVSEAVQKTYISVDEQGTEAAAVTAIGIKTTSIGNTPRTVVFDADRPFTYVVRDNSNGEILFMGEYAFS